MYFDLDARVTKMEDHRLNRQLLNVKSSSYYWYSYYSLINQTYVHCSPREVLISNCESAALLTVF